MAVNTIDNLGQPKLPERPAIQSMSDAVKLAEEEATGIFGPRQTIPVYNPENANEAAQVHSYSDMVRSLAGSYAPKGETEKDRKSRRINAAIAAIGDVVTHGLNTGAAMDGGTPMQLDPSQSLSALSKARYDKVVATQQANRDKYLSLLLKAADIDTKYGGTAKSNYNKAYDAQVKGVNATNTARDNYIKNRVAGIQKDNENLMRMYGVDSSNYNSAASRAQSDEHFYAPQTVSVDGTSEQIVQDPTSMTFTKEQVGNSSTRTITRQRPKRGF